MKKTFARRISIDLGPSWDRISAAKLWFALGAISLALTWGGFHFFDRYGLVVGFFLAVALDALVFYYDDWRLLGQFPAMEIEGRDAWDLRGQVEKLAKRLALPTPRLLEVESDTPFIFSAGLFRSRLKIFLSSQVARRLTADELQAVIAYELVKCKTGQTRTITGAVALADLYLIFIGALDSAFFLRVFMRRKLSRVHLGPLTYMSIPLVALFLRLVIWRSRIRELDRQTAEEFSNHQTLARAFLKLDAYAKTLPLDVNFAEAALFCVTPLATYDWSRWASVQTPLEGRTQALTGRYPL